MTRATPSSMAARSQQAPVLFRHGDERPVGPRAGPVAGVHEEHQREQPGHLAVVGQRRVERPG